MTGETVKFMRILSFAIVAMFIMTASIVPACASDAYSDTTDYSNGVYISFKDVKQEDFEKIYNRYSYYDLLDLGNILSGVFSSSFYSTAYADYSVSFDSISVTMARTNSLSDNYHTTASVSDIEFKNLKITLTFKSMPSDPYASSVDYKDFTEIIQYLKDIPVATGTEVVIETGNYHYTESQRTTIHYLPINNGEKYMRDNALYKKSSSVSTVANVDVNKKMLTFSIDETMAVEYTMNTESDSPDYAIDSYAIGEMKENVKEDSVNDTLKANGKTYECVKHDSALKLLNMAVGTYATKITSSSYSSLPSEKRYDYNDIYYMLSSDNDKAKKEIEAIGGNCDMTVESANNAIDGAYNSSMSSNESSDSWTTWAIIAIVAIALILVIAFIALFIIHKRRF